VNAARSQDLPNVTRDDCLTPEIQLLLRLRRPLGDDGTKIVLRLDSGDELQA